MNPFAGKSSSLIKERLKLMSYAISGGVCLKLDEVMWAPMLYPFNKGELGSRRERPQEQDWFISLEAWLLVRSLSYQN
ncbi:hypothetical protein CEXT_555991 [Caerostris extrusa]|uniref:Uncharacterized protein n=1 Tax=Caerostris extrusa TaxID=172846 RepID=A0AAV4TEX6_CAEEX|nr:hypothetical protein CEXT_555991 [Caerostris extrusa]